MNLVKSNVFTKAIAVVLAIALSVLALAGCASNNSNSGSTSSETKSEDKTIKVGASPSPHAEILNQIKDDLKEQGYTLDIVEYNDYVQPNNNLEDGQLDANYFQHIAYLNNFNEENGTHLVNAGGIHFEPMRVFAGKTKSLADLSDGATVAVPNDTTNEARALLLLEQEGLIKLKDGAGINATKLDIVENPHNLNIQEVEAAQVPRSIDSVDIIVVNCNYALSAGLNINDSLAVESETGEAAKVYVNVVAVKEGNENSDKTKALIKALQSDKVKKYIEDTYEGAVEPLFTDAK